ncbi:hypothetical protein V2W23_14515, partial [Staphylococcus gallinarum]|uniref:hypothetical protein n=1 Tax=Staphylococcus gallinarum TaxID=1293 RepID=UPI003180F488
KETIIDLLHQHRSEKGFIITDHDYTNIIRASSQILLITNGICKKINDLKELEFWHYAPPGTFSS